MGSSELQADPVIRNRIVVGGTGPPGRQADVVIVGDRIIAVEDRFEGTTEREIGASGKIVTPGFVDVHTGNLAGRLVRSA